MKRRSICAVLGGHRSYYGEGGMWKTNCSPKKSVKQLFKGHPLDYGGEGRMW